MEAQGAVLHLPNGRLQELNLVVVAGGLHFSLVSQMPIRTSQQGQYIVIRACQLGDEALVESYEQTLSNPLETRNEKQSCRV